VQADSFWRLNILSPDKLREKWDDVKLKLRYQGNGEEPSEYRMLKPLEGLIDD
jgi:hypothetical protein